MISCIVAFKEKIASEIRFIFKCSLSSKTTVQLYAVEDDLSDWIYNLHLPKPFLKTDETMPLFDPYGKISRGGGGIVTTKDTLSLFGKNFKN